MFSPMDGPECHQREADSSFSHPPVTWAGVELVEHLRQRDKAKVSAQEESLRTRNVTASRASVDWLTVKMKRPERTWNLSLN